MTTVVIGVAVHAPALTERNRALPPEEFPVRETVVSAVTAIAARRASASRTNAMPLS